MSDGSQRLYEPLSTAEASAALGVCEETIRRAIRRGELEAFKVGTGPNAHWKVEAEAIQQFKRRARSLRRTTKRLCQGAEK